MCCRSAKDPFTLLCTSWSKKAGSRPSGSRRRITGARSFIRSPGQKATRIGGGELAAAVPRPSRVSSSFQRVRRSYADGTLVVHGAVAAEVYSARPPGGGGARSGAASPMGFPQKRRRRHL